MTGNHERLIRAAVVGVGYYGNFHAQKYATLPGCQLAAVVDVCPYNGSRAALEYGVPCYTNHRELVGKIDVASVAVPAHEHYVVARDLIKAGIHVLVEKPITGRLAEAKELIRLAEEHNVILQVGHLERFNPVFKALPQELRSPSYIESHRLTPFPRRNGDVSVVLDLMIHDIDLALVLAQAPVKTIQAKGISVFSDDVDMVNALIYFTNGAVANLTASRASPSPQRLLQLFQHNAHTSLDLYAKRLVIQRRAEATEQGIEAEHAIKIEESQWNNEDILRSEVEEFLEVVRGGGVPSVSGQDGLMALATAQRIMHVLDHDNTAIEQLGYHEAGQGYSESPYSEPRHRESGHREPRWLSP